MFGLRTIARRLPLALVATAALVSLGVGIGSYLIGSETVRSLTERNLSSIAHERARAVEVFMSTVSSDVMATASSQSTVQALRDFGNAWMQLDGNHTAELHKVYITDNPNAAGKREMLDDGPPGMPYAMTHFRFNPTFRDQIHAHDYADFYLIGVDGNVYYSVGKSDEFATNLLAEGAPYQGSQLAAVFQQAVAQGKPGLPPVVVDFAPFGASRAASAFVASPVFNATGRMIGVVAIRFVSPLVGKIVADRTGLGDTGETILVGADNLLRVDSMFVEGEDTLATRIDSPAIDAAMKRRESAGISENYRGAEMFIAAAPVRAGDVRWAVVAVTNPAEVFAPIVSMRNTMLAVGGGLLAIAALVGLWFSRSVTKPITQLTGTMKALAEGQLETAITGTTRRDEIGEMARTVEVFRDNALEGQQPDRGGARRLGAPPPRAHDDDAGAAELVRRGGRRRRPGRFFAPRRGRVPRPRAQRHRRLDQQPRRRPSSAASARPGRCSRRWRRPTSRTASRAIITAPSRRCATTPTRWPSGSARSSASCRRPRAR